MHSRSVVILASLALQIMKPVSLPDELGVQEAETESAPLGLGVDVFQRVLPSDGNKPVGAVSIHGFVIS